MFDEILCATRDAPPAFAWEGGNKQKNVTTDKTQTTTTNKQKDKRTQPTQQQKTHKTQTFGFLALE